jgi:hypothetical protein
MAESLSLVGQCFVTALNASTRDGHHLSSFSFLWMVESAWRRYINRRMAVARRATLRSSSVTTRDSHIVSFSFGERLAAL